MTYVSTYSRHKNLKSLVYQEPVVTAWVSGTKSINDDDFYPLKSAARSASCVIFNIYSAPCATAIYMPYHNSNVGIVAVESDRFNVYLHKCSLN